MPNRKPTIRTTRVSRPYILAYQRGNRWYIAAYPNQREAEEKANRLIDRGRVLVLLCRCYAEIRPDTEGIATNDEESESAG